jgi:tetratricopeptide (TPR) repeat protein
MGWVYMVADMYQEAIPYFLNCRETARQDSLITPAKTALNFLHLGNCYRQTEKYDSALHCFREALIINETNHIENIDRVLRHMAVCYYSLGEYDTAEIYLDKARDASLNHGDVFGLANINLFLGRIAAHRNQYHKALDHYSKTIQHALWIVKNRSEYSLEEKELDNSYVEAQNIPESKLNKGLHHLMNAHGEASVICKKIGDFKGSTHHLEQYLEARRQQDILDKEREVLELNTRYQTERTRQQVIMLEKDNELAKSNIQKSRWALFGISGLLVLIIFIGFLLLRQKSIRSDQEKISLQQKLFRSQLKPHFLYNSLTSIQKFIVTEDPDKASVYLSNFSRLVRNILESSIDEYVTLEKEINTIEYYLSLQKTRFDEKFDYSVETDQNLDTENIEIPAMLAQPFIENAIEHGIRHKKGKGIVAVRIKRMNDYLMLEIEDDGVGRLKAQEMLAGKNSDHRSVATALTRERIKLLNKKRKEKISLEIIDLQDKGTALGTLVRFSVPLT